jgi:tetratricopeptide (TPR) repeat protein
MRKFSWIFSPILILSLFLCVSLSLEANTEDLNIVGKDADIFKKAVAYEDEGNITDAVATYRLYLKNNKDIAPAYFYLGNLYWESDHKEKALETFKQAEEACPG